jgi:hypothetical protein
MNTHASRTRGPPGDGTVLVTGVHSEELAFGDRVTAGLGHAAIEVLRIPKGVPQRCTDVDRQFRHEARQRELYLQLHQQVRGRYRALIDLHSGVDENGPSADIYCHDPGVLDRLARQLDDDEPVRLVKIVAPGEPLPRTGGEAGARTCIPEAVWAGGPPLYVGLEIYLPDDGQPGEAERLAQRLIACIQDCVAAVR